MFARILARDCYWQLDWVVEGGPGSIVLPFWNSGMTPFSFFCREVHALVRPETLDDLQKDAMRRQFSSMGAKLVIASYDDHESLVKACRSVDVVLSCVGVRYIAWLLNMPYAFKYLRIQFKGARTRCSLKWRAWLALWVR